MFRECPFQRHWRRALSVRPNADSLPTSQQKKAAGAFPPRTRTLRVSLANISKYSSRAIHPEEGSGRFLIVIHRYWTTPTHHRTRSARELGVYRKSVTWRDTDRREVCRHASFCIQTARVRVGRLDSGDRLLSLSSPLALRSQLYQLHRCVYSGQGADPQISMMARATHGIFSYHRTRGGDERSEYAQSTGVDEPWMRILSSQAVCLAWIESALPMNGVEFGF